MNQPINKFEGPLDQLKARLRDEHRIKHNVDWCYAVSYGWDVSRRKVRILCQELWEDTIREEAKAIGIEITSLSTFSE